MPEPGITILKTQAGAINWELHTPELDISSAVQLARNLHDKLSEEFGELSVTRRGYNTPRTPKDDEDDLIPILETLEAHGKMAAAELRGTVNYLGQTRVGPIIQMGIERGYIIEKKGRGRTKYRELSDLGRKKLRDAKN